MFLFAYFEDMVVTFHDQFFKTPQRLSVELYVHHIFNWGITSFLSNNPSNDCLSIMIQTQEKVHIDFAIFDTHCERNIIEYDVNCFVSAL